MCFFHSYIVFEVEGKGPSKYTDHLKYFLLFLIFLAELLKINMINTKIFLKFFNVNGLDYVSLAIDSSLEEFLTRYNMINENKYHLFHYLQEYLWEHWKKNITFSNRVFNCETKEFNLLSKSDKIIIVEVLLQNKKTE
jgi:hypothetical protein